MTRIEELEATLRAAEQVRDNAFAALKSAMIAELPYQVGSLVDAEQYGKMVRCRVTNLHIESWGGRAYEIYGSAYPIKKNGETASIGEIRLQYSSKVIPVPEAPPVTEEVTA